MVCAMTDEGDPAAGEVPTGSDDDCWAEKWGTHHDIVADILVLEWTDKDGSHSAAIHGPDPGRQSCVARFVTPALADVVCGRIAGHAGCHVSIGDLARTGAVAD
jgi:hypothetical protein